MSIETLFCSFEMIDGIALIRYADVGRNGNLEAEQLGRMDVSLCRFIALDRFVEAHGLSRWPELSFA